VIRSRPEDFRVEEIPAYLPSGAGAHLYVRFRKTGLDTMEAVRRLAAAIGVQPRDAGTAGLKDRHAITIQWASFPLSENKPIPSLEALSSPGLEALEAARHGNKLRTGHLRGNRFSLVLRQIAEADVPRVVASLTRVGTEGLPNWFGAQRFGRAGDNATMALAWMRGERPAPRDARVKRLQFSALQSDLFHRVLEKRIERGTWDTVIAGDLVQVGPGPAVFVSEDPVADTARARSGDIFATGPLFGSRMRKPTGEALALELEVLASIADAEALFAKWSTLGEGARRPFRLAPQELSATALHEGGSVHVDFMLPKGAYATSVIEAACSMRDASRGTAAPSAEGSGHRSPPVEGAPEATHEQEIE